MPVFLKDLDVTARVAGLNSALIVPCNMCPAVTVAVREEQPFLQPFRSILTSAPYERYIRALQSRLAEQNVTTEVFRSSIYHQWFLCMWTAGQRKKLENFAKGYEAVIVLGCDSAAETVRGAVSSIDCRVIEGMGVAGLLNAKMSLRWPGYIFFEDCRITPISQLQEGE